MTEQEWLASADPRVMLAWLTDTTAGPCLLATDRKKRLFACACCRQVWHLLTDERSRRAALVAERYADGAATGGEMMSARRQAELVDGWGWCATGLDIAVCLRQQLYHQSGISPPPAAEAALLRCLFGNPWRPVKFVQNPQPVQRIARTIYDERRWDELPILADALEEAGCPADVPCEWCRGTGCTGWRGNLQTGSADPVCAGCDSRGTLPHPLLAHLRSPGPHARGCHALDLVLGKE